MKGITRADLSGEMGELAELLGVDVVLKLCQLYGGDNLYIPVNGERMSDDMREMQEIIGAVYYEQMQKRYCGNIIYFPLPQTALKEFIASRVRCEYDGTNRRRLMRKYNLTKNSFYRIIENKQKEKLPEDDKQLTLYDFLTD